MIREEKKIISYELSPEEVNKAILNYINSDPAVKTGRAEFEYKMLSSGGTIAKVNIIEGVEK